MNVMTWNDLPEIHEVGNLDETDERCLEEIKGILDRYGKSRRFGIALLHQHFMLSHDELLVEHCDVERRTLVTTPVKATEVIPRRYLPTVWRFDGQRVQACSYCPTNNGQHAGYKDDH